MIRSLMLSLRQMRITSSVHLKIIPLECLISELGNKLVRLNTVHTFVPLVQTNLQYHQIVNTLL